MFTVHEALIQLCPSSQITLTSVRGIASDEDATFTEVLLHAVSIGQAQPFSAAPPPEPYIGYSRELTEARASLIHAANSKTKALFTIGGRSGCGVTAFMRKLAALLNESRKFSGGVFLVDASACISEAACVSMVCDRCSISVQGSASAAMTNWIKALGTYCTARMLLLC